MKNYIVAGVLVVAAIACAVIFSQNQGAPRVAVIEKGGEPETKVRPASFANMVYKNPEGTPGAAAPERLPASKK